MQYPVCRIFFSNKNGITIQLHAEGFAVVEAYVDACAPTSPGALVNSRS